MSFCSVLVLLTALATPPQESHVVTRDVDAVMTIKFAKDKADLAESDRVALRALANRIKGDRQFSHFVVAAWSDMDFPKRGVTLPRDQRALAADRIAAVKAALMKPGAGEIQTFDFADHAWWLGRVFNSESAKLKSEAGLISKTKDEASVALGREIQEKGGPGTAVVVLVDRQAIGH